MIVIPLKTTKPFEIAPPILEWISNEENLQNDDGTIQLQDIQSSSNDANYNVNNGENIDGFFPNSNLSNNNKNDIRPSPEQIRHGIGSLNLIRKSLADSFSSIFVGNKHDKCDEMALYLHTNLSIEECEKILNNATQYHAYLLECQRRRFFPENGHIPDLILEWDCAFEKTRESLICSNLHYERAAILFNIGAIESLLASKEDMTTSRGLTSALNRYNTAAGIFSHLRTEVLPILSSTCQIFDASNKNTNMKGNAKSTTSPESQSAPVMLTLDLTSPSLKMCENMLLAQGQACMYEMARFRPMHNVLAKISMGAAEIYNEVLLSSRYNSVRAHMTYVGQWGAHFKTMSIFFKARAVFHESVCAREGCIRARANDNGHGKPGAGYGLEIARLVMADSLCEQALLLAENASVDINMINDLKQSIIERKGQAERENDSIHKEDIPSSHDLEPTRGQRMSKIFPLKKKITEISPSLFHIDLNQNHDISENHVNKSKIKKSNENNSAILTKKGMELERFKAESKEILLNCKNIIQKETESARYSLAEVNLPDSLQEYNTTKQGIPQSTWQKIEAIQKNNEIEKVRNGLLELRDLSDDVHETAKKINEQLDEDVRLDDEFRKKFRTFKGSDVKEVQKATRHSMTQCGQLLTNAKGGDNVLLQYLQKLDTESKFLLLQYDKNHLDNLTPSSSKIPKADTSLLSTHLVELSNLFHQREHYLNMLKQDIEGFDAKALMSSIDPNLTLESSKSKESLIEEKLQYYKQIQANIKSNIEKQSVILPVILSLNENLKNSQPSLSGSNSNLNFVELIDEGVSTLKIVSQQLEDGKQFYNSLIPKLNHLNQHVSYMSISIAVQRFDHEDSIKSKTERELQEIEDEKIAKQLSLSNTIDPSQETGNDGFDGGHQHPENIDASNSEMQYHRRTQNPSNAGPVAFLSTPPNVLNNLTTQSFREPISRFSNQRGNDSFQNHLVEPQSNRATSASGSFNGRYSPTPHPIPLARSTSMSSFGRQNDTIQPPDYMAQPPNPGQPGIYYQSNFKPLPIRVDDEKVAKLVAMEFDAEKVVHSLRKYDNNFDQALNDLLSG